MKIAFSTEKHSETFMLSVNRGLNFDKISFKAFQALCFYFELLIVLKATLENKFTFTITNIYNSFKTPEGQESSRK